MKKAKNILLQVLPVSIFATILVVAIIYAWTEPTASPPGGNVPAPINIGSAQQWKEGGLGVGTKTFDLSSGQIAASTFYDRDNSAWYVNPAGTTVLAGNVGIGASPGQTLDVQGGNINTSGVYMRAGTSGISSSCPGGQTFSGLTSSGGIITSTGACAAIGGGGGAPTDASYVVLGLNGTLTAERVLTAGAGLSLADTGANGNATLSVSTSGITSTHILDGTITSADVGFNYAGSSSKGGAAATALTLSADGSNCAGGQYAQGVDASGNSQGCSAPAGGGDITGVYAGTGLSGGGSSGEVTLSLNPASANTWTGAQTFNANTNFPGSGIWNTSGNVGIGTTSPTEKLEVAGNIKWSGILTGGSVPWARVSGFTGDTTADTIADDGVISSAEVNFNYAGSSSKGGPATNALVLAADGSNCAGGQYAQGVDASGNSQGCSAPAGGVSGSGTANYISKWTGGTSLGNSSLSDNGAGTISGIAGGIGVGSVSTGWYSDGANLAARFPGGAGAFYVQSPGAGTTYMQSGAAVGGTMFPSGNVGIGTPSPGGKLDVNGQIKIQGGSPGAGKVLTSDASGLASWQAAGGTTSSVAQPARSMNTAYQNASGKNLFVTIQARISSAGCTYWLEPKVGSSSPPSITVGHIESCNSTEKGYWTFVVPPNWYYGVYNLFGVGSAQYWTEAL